MRYAKHIGRVGGLAVALGVGLGVGPVHGIPLAQATEPSSESSSTDGSTTKDSTSDTTGSPSTGTPTSTDGATTNGATGGDTGGGSTGDTTGATGGDVAAGEDEDPPADLGDGTDSTADSGTASSPTSGDQSTPTPGAAGGTAGGSPSHSSSSNSAAGGGQSSPDISDGGDTSAGAESDPEPAGLRATDSDTSEGNPATDQGSAVGTGSSDDGPAPAAMSAFSAFADEPVVPAAAPASPIAQLVSSLLSWVGLGPSATQTPLNTPVESPFAWGLLAWVRRSFDGIVAGALGGGLPQQVGTSETDAQRSVTALAAANTPPVADDETYTVAEDGTLTVAAASGVLTGDTDANGDKLTVAGNTTPAHGTVTIAANGSLTYKPVANYNGTDTFNYTVSDGKGGTDTGTVTVNVTAVNDAPVAGNDSYTTAEDTKLTVPASNGALVNDTDVDGDTLTVISATQPAHGTITGGVDGSFTYTPNANYNGADTFKYTVSDGKGKTAIGTVTVNVTAVNDAPTTDNETYTTTEDKPLTVAATNGVLVGDKDADGDALSVVGNTAPAHGTVTVSSNGALTYTPTANYNGTDTFNYTASDGKGGTATGTVTINVTAVNDAPVAGGGTLTTPGNTAVSSTLPGSDVDSPTLTYAITNQPAKGTISGFNAATGAYTYTPNAGYTGADTFKYTVSDGTTTTAAATITINVTGVNQPPVANGGSITTNEDTASTNNKLPATDPDSATLTYAITQQPTKGTISGFNAATGNYTYTPNANANGVDSFKYTVSDGTTTTAPATINVTINAVNDAPVAPGGTATTNEDTAVSGILPGSDIDSGTLTYAITQNPTKGTISKFNAATGAYTYTPNANTNGVDTIKYTVSDGTTTTAPATLTITVAPVNDAPVAPGGTATTNEDTAVSGTLPGSDIDSGTLTYVITQNPTKGTISLNASTGAYTYTPNANTNGGDTIKYTVSDGTTTTAPATLTITVNPVNDIPVAVNDSYSVAAGGTLTVPAATGVLANDTDVDGDTLQAMGATQPAHGVVTGGLDGSFTYTPTAGYSGADSFTYAVADGKGGMAIGTVTVTVTAAVNQPPVAPGGTATTNEDTAVSGTLPATDPDSTTLTYAITQQPTKGTISGFNAATGAYTYTPNANTNGVDTIKYTVSDGTTTTAPATLTITVNPVNDAPVAPGGTATTNEDTAVSGTLPGSDIDSGTLTYAITQNPTKGTISGFNAATGAYTYTPTANTNGVDTIKYTVSDGTTTTAPATVTITVTPVNDAPVAVNDSYSVAAGGTLTVPAATGVLANDGDIDGDTLTVVSNTTPAHGALTSGLDGSFTYTPTAGYSGPDTFTYTASDGKGGTAVGTVTINVTAVNQPPVAPGGTATTNEDTAVSGTLPATDPDSTTLTYAITQQPTKGTISLNAATGAYTYTPNANANGVDTIKYTVSDGTTTTAPATLTITVAPVNDAPVAPGGTATTNEDTPVSGTLPGSDIDSGTLTYAITQNPTKGTISGFNAATGAYTYTPNANTNGVDTIKYTVSDGTTTTAPATVTITVNPVNDAPVANNGSITTNEDTPASGTLPGSDIDSSTLTYTITQNPTKGTISLNAATGAYTYTPSLNANGADTFKYTVSDGTTTTAPATVTITVNPVNDAPVAVNDSYSVATGGTLTVPAATGALSNDYDVDGDTITAISATQGAHGSLVGGPDGSFTYKPTTGYSGVDTFTYTISDGKGGTATGTVTVTVGAVNQPPVAPGGSATTNEDTPLTGTLPASDPDSTALTYAITQQPTKGTISLNAATGAYTYMPSANANGTDTIKYTVSDGTTTTAPATLTITVNPVNDPPVANGGSIATNQDAAVSSTLPASDIDSSTLTYAITQQPTKGTISGFNAATGAYTYTPNAGYTGADTIKYTASDGTTTTAPATVTITVTAISQPPVAGNSTLTIDEDTSTTSNLPGTDPDSTTLTFTITQQPTHGTISAFNAATGNYTYTPNTDYNGTDTIKYTVSDGTTTTAPATVTINITAVNDTPVAGGDTYTTIAGTPVTKTLPATDPDNTSLTYTITQLPTHGTVSGFNSATGSYTYTPATNYSGADTIKYTVSDGNTTSTVGTVSISVSNSSTAPVIQSVSAGATNTTTGAITYTVTVADPNTPLANLGLSVSDPAVGKITTPQSTTPGTYTFTYTPTQLGRMFAGSTLAKDYDSFNISVSDGTQTTTATVTAEIYTGTMLTGGGLIPGFGPSAIISSGNKVYVANAGSNSVAVFNNTTGAMLGSLTVGTAPTALAVSSDGTRVYVANSNGNSVSVIDTTTGTAGTVLTTPIAVTNPTGVAVSGTGANTRLYVTSGSTDTVTVFNPATGATIGSPINVGDKPIGIAVNSAGTKAYVANSAGNSVSVINLANNSVTTVNVGTTPQQVALNSAGTRLYVTNTGSDNVSVIDTASGTVIATIGVGDSPYGITVSNDGSVAYVANGDNTVSVLNLMNNTKVTGTIQAETGPTGGVAMGQNGTLYVTYSGGATMRTVTMTHIADPPPPAGATTNIPNTAPVFLDFNGPAGRADPNIWNYWQGAGGDGRIMVLTNDLDNAAQDGNGNLVITAIKEQGTDQLGGTWPWTSAFLETDDKFEFTYGTVAARIDFPTDIGLHPTFWMLGTDYDQIGWPNTGEIDILDSYQPFDGSGIHGPGAYNVYEATPDDIDIGDGFHTYWTKWEPDKITVGIDDQTTAVYTPDSLPPGTPWTFNDRAMYLNLSLDVGGPYGTPDPDLPQGWSSSMVIDWISYTPL